MAFSKIQSVSVGTTGAASATTIAATVSAVGSGNVICGLVSWDDIGPSLTSVTDNQGNTYNLETTILNVGDGQRNAAFSRTNITNAPTVITANFSATVDFRAIFVDEFSGGSTASTDERDGTAHGGQYQASPGTGTDAVTSGSFTTAVNGDLLWGGSSTQSVITLTIGTSFSAGGSAGGGPVCATEYRVQTTAGSGTAATFTESGTSGPTVTYLIAIKPPGGAAAVPFKSYDWSVNKILPDWQPAALQPYNQSLYSVTYTLMGQAWC